MKAAQELIQKENLPGKFPTVWPPPVCLPEPGRESQDRDCAPEAVGTWAIQGLSPGGGGAGGWSGASAPVQVPCLCRLLIQLISGHTLVPGKVSDYD